MMPFAGIREARGLCLNRAAARLGITPAYLRRLERGKVRLTLPMAQRMASAYLCSISDLVK